MIHKKNGYGCRKSINCSNPVFTLPFEDSPRDVRVVAGTPPSDAAQVRQQGGEGSRIPGVVRNGRRHLHRVSVLGRAPAGYTNLRSALCPIP
jgi:hypothetical protein